MKNKVGRPSKKDIRKRNIRKYGLVFILVLLISIGFAGLTTVLNITGNTKVKGNTFDVHFDDISLITEEYDAPVYTNDDHTEISFDITLEKPGDVYKFKLVAKNAGTLDAQLKSMTLGGHEDMSDLLNYTVTTSDGDPVMVGGLLKSGDSRPLLVTVEYNKDIDTDELVTDTNLKTTLTLAMEYVQAGEVEGFDPYLQYGDIVSNEGISIFLKPENLTFDSMYFGFSEENNAYVAYDDKEVVFAKIAGNKFGKTYIKPNGQIFYDTTPEIYNAIIQNGGMMGLPCTVYVEPGVVFNEAGLPNNAFDYTFITGEPLN